MLRRTLLAGSQGPLLLRKYTDVNKAQLDKLLQKGALLVDVRSPEEIGPGQPGGGLIEINNNKSRNVPLTELDGALKLSPEAFKSKYKFDKPKPESEIVFTCKGGKRSPIASEIAEKLKYKNVFNYPGGTIDWFKQG